jgi:hypothetical protein
MERACGVKSWCRWGWQGHETHRVHDWLAKGLYMLESVCQPMHVRVPWLTHQQLQPWTLLHDRHSMCQSHGCDQRLEPWARSKGGLSPGPAARDALFSVDAPYEAPYKRHLSAD